MKVLTAGVKSSNKKSKKKKSSNNYTKQQQQSHSTTNTNDTTNNNNNDIESAAAAAVDSSTNTVDNRLNNTPVNDNINGGHSGKFFCYLYINVWLFCVLQNQPASYIE